MPKFRLLFISIMLLGVGATIAETDDTARALLVGNWFGEMSCNLCGDSDSLRWTRLNTADGAQRVHFRYFRDGKIRRDVIRLGRWGYQNGVYWLACESYHVDGKPQACPHDYYEFVVDSLDAERMTYHSDKFGVRYTARRVADDFRLRDRN